MGRSAGKTLKRLAGSDMAKAALGGLAAGYLRLVHAGVRWQIEGSEHRDAALGGDGGLIAAFWHGRLLITPMLPSGARQRVAMISRARDGDIITAVVGRFGIETVRGSTRDRIKGQAKGGSEAFAAAVEAVHDGALVGITPDGPIGPRMRAHGGAAALALATGAAVLPLSYSTARGRLLGSWDRFLLPAPFGRGAIVYGRPLRPEAVNGDPDRFRLAIEAALTEAQNRADALCGRAAIDAGPD